MDLMTLHFSINGSDFNIPSRVLRMEDKRTAVRFLHQKGLETISQLWEFIFDNLKLQPGICPYCDSEIKNKAEQCPNCGLFLNFDSKNYLIEHINRTAYQRIAQRIQDFKADQKWSIVNILDNEFLKDKARYDDFEFVGTCPEMLQAFSLIRKIAPTEIPVLILGESGTGKELTTRAIHERSLRKGRPLVTINCASIPDTLLEAELFGYERGSFTGAYNARKGKIEKADGGTLFLDEIGELQWPLQAKLLRFLEDKTVERIGSRKPRKVDVRVIAATNRKLEEEVQSGIFRQDLYYRLNTFTIELPPLRERGQDKVILAKYFLKTLAKENGATKKKMSKESLEAIIHYEWPGNIREMINKIRRAIVVSEDMEITPKDLSLTAHFTPFIDEKATLKEVKTRIEKEKILSVISTCGGNLSKTAKTLGVSRTTLYNLKRKYDI
jgi:transcriptional regulator with PAS, ATPase and Fis domain